MKFLCDEMLARLGRWLRAAGYDTEIAKQGQSDSEIIERAKLEKRLLLTRDTHFLEMTKEDLIWLQGNLLEECIAELMLKLPINWLFKPFSRCLVCNRELVRAPPSSLTHVPERICQEKPMFWHCDVCQKIYWDGSHTKRMLQQLHEFQAIQKRRIT